MSKAKLLDFKDIVDAVAEELKVQLKIQIQLLGIKRLSESSLSSSCAFLQTGSGLEGHGC